MNLGLDGKIALVFASSKGIGKAIALLLAQEGCKLMLASRSKENLIAAYNEIQQQVGGDISWHICDLSSYEQIHSTIENTLKIYGRIDILVNNCGGPPPSIFSNTSDEDWMNAFNDMMMSTIRATREVIEVMKQNRFGRVINITSITIKQPAPNLLLSNSIRAGITGLAKSLANEYAEYNITVNNVAPGFTLTSRLYDLANEQAKIRNVSYEDILKEYTKNIPMQRLAKPEEIANAVAFLASERAAYITGQTIVVDGGYTKNLF